MGEDWALARATPVVIDMQRLFVRPGRWGNPDALGIVANIRRVLGACPAPALFTRFVVPARASDAKGCWRAYYEHWDDYTAARLPADAVDIIDELADLAAPARIFDKQGHAAFDAPAFAGRLACEAAETLVLMGIETDVCVLATALAAVDHGYRVVAVSDAMTSSSPAGHAATIAHVLPRFDQQIRIVTADALIDAQAA